MKLNAGATHLLKLIHRDTVAQGKTWAKLSPQVLGMLEHDVPSELILIRNEPLAVRLTDRGRVVVDYL